MKLLLKPGLIVLVLVIIVLTMIACGNKTSQPETPTPIASPTAVSNYQNLTVEEARSFIQQNVDLVILDVRTKEEYDIVHLQNAVLIPVSELPTRLSELDKSKKILVYCKAGGRSAKASGTLVSDGFGSIYNMLGGIDAWTQAGYPVVLNSAD